MDWNSDTNPTTFANNSTHALKFFYLERGNTDSNLYLKYNLTEIPVTAIYKVDQYGRRSPVRPSRYTRPMRSISTSAASTARSSICPTGTAMTLPEI